MPGIPYFSNGVRLFGRVAEWTSTGLENSPKDFRNSLLLAQLHKQKTLTKTAGNTMSYHEYP